MKKLTIPHYDDSDILELLSENENLGSFPTIRDSLTELLAAYTDYNIQSGNPWIVNTLVIPQELKTFLKGHYKSPPVDLAVIKEMRDNDSPDVCPMCGSFNTSSLDHYLPKENYPWFAIFTNNLIPACSCNTTKGTTVLGAINTERVLHPYYDNCLEHRLITSTITGVNLDIPNISIVPINGHCNPDTLNFHIEKVIKKTKIIKLLACKWVSITRRPKSLIKTLPKNTIITFDECREYISDCLDDYDNEFGTPNNWYSILLSGISSNNDVIRWIQRRHNDIINGVVVPT